MKIRFEPIAAEVAKRLPVAVLFPPGVLEDIRRGQREDEPEAPKLPSDIEEFMVHYLAVVQAAGALLDAPPFEALSRLKDALAEEYMPGAPPMSPVYYSMHMLHVLGEVPVGVADETPLSVIAKVTSGSSNLSRFHALARALVDSFRDVYLVKSAKQQRAEISPVRGGDPIAIGTTGPFLRTGDLVLMRVLPFEGKYFVADSPYILKAPARDWLDYFARVVDARGASAPSRRPKGNLSGKQLAKWRKLERDKSGSADPESLLRKHLRGDPPGQFWFDYAMDGYAGERNGIVFLAGVPDRPESLPHSAASERAREKPPMNVVHDRLQDVAANHGMLARAAKDLEETCKRHGVQKFELDPNELQLFVAYSTLEARSEAGETALDHVARTTTGAPELQRVCEDLRRGGFAVLGIDRIRLDEGLEVSELRSKKKLYIAERSGTRQLAKGDVLLGWVCADEAGTLTLEGHVTRVPSLFAAVAEGLVSQLVPRGARRPRDFNAPAGLLPVQLLVGLREARENFRPELVNHDDERLQLATGRYRIVDLSRIAPRLREAFTMDDEQSYVWLNDAGTVVARIEIAGDKLLVHVNSLQRLAAAKERIEALLGDAIQASLGSVEQDVFEAARSGKRSRADQPIELPPELAAQMCEMVTRQIGGMLDAPIPQFRGKSLRQVARSKPSRPDAVSWLREQERLLKTNPRLSGVDLRPIWQELGLEYQGLDTDPAAY
jgi:hypothetical protein